jgi:hypothetical protein
MIKKAKSNRVSKNQSITIKLPKEVLALADECRRVHDEDLETFILNGVLANCQTTYQDVEGHKGIKRLWKEAGACGYSNPAI